MLLFIGLVKASGSSPYISPGIQLGITTKANFFCQHKLLLVMSVIMVHRLMA